MSHADLMSTNKIYGNKTSPPSFIPPNCGIRTLEHMTDIPSRPSDDLSEDKTDFLASDFVEN